MKDLIVIYRILYGTDFLERSIRSVVDVADRVCVYFSTQPWSCLLYTSDAADE